MSTGSRKQTPRGERKRANSCSPPGFKNSEKKPRTKLKPKGKMAAQKSVTTTGEVSDVSEMDQQSPSGSQD